VASIQKVPLLPGIKISNLVPERFDPMANDRQAAVESWVAAARLVDVEEVLLGRGVSVPQDLFRSLKLLPGQRFPRGQSQGCMDMNPDERMESPSGGSSEHLLIGEDVDTIPAGAWVPSWLMRPVDEGTAAMAAPGGDKSPANTVDGEGAAERKGLSPRCSSSGVASNPLAINPPAVRIFLPIANRTWRTSTGGLNRAAGAEL